MTSKQITIISTIISQLVQPANRRNMPSTESATANRLRMQLVLHSVWNARERGAGVAAGPSFRPRRLLQVAAILPDRIFLAELAERVPGLLEFRALGGLLDRDLIPRLLEGGNELGPPGHELDALAFDFDHRLGLQRFTEADAFEHGLVARRLDDQLLGRRKRVPLGLVDDQVADGGLLMPPGEVVELRHLVEAEAEIHHRHGELG